MPRLIVDSPEVTQQTYELNDQLVTVGRAADNTIAISHASISGHHAELSLVDGDYKLTDLNSTNGSRINDERVTEGVLRNKDILQLGNIIFLYESENVLEAPPLPDAESAITLTGVSKGRPIDFVNFSPFPKPSTESKSAFFVVLGCALVALGGVAFFIVRLLTVA